MSSFRELTDYPLAFSGAAQAAAFAGNVTLVTVPFKGSLVRVRFIPSAAITFNAANYCTLTVQNKGTAGAVGTTAMAQRVFNAVSAVGSPTAEDWVVTPGVTQVVNEGDQLNLNFASAGTGLAVPAYSLMLFFAAHN